MNLFLDDIRNPENSKANILNISDWVIVRDYFDFINTLTDNFDDIELISFDHDLACFKDDVEFTGLDAVIFLINYCIDNGKKLPNWYLHTDNVIGESNMKGTLLSYIKNFENVDSNACKYFHKGFINNKFI